MSCKTQTCVYFSSHLLRVSPCVALLKNQVAENFLEKHLKHFEICKFDGCVEHSCSLIQPVTYLRTNIDNLAFSEIFLERKMRDIRKQQ